MDHKSTRERGSLTRSNFAKRNMHSGTRLLRFRRAAVRRTALLDTAASYAPATAPRAKSVSENVRQTSYLFSVGQASLPPAEHSGQGCPENRQSGLLPWGDFTSYFGTSTESRIVRQKERLIDLGLYVLNAFGAA